jgi:hypothetical protein
VQQIESVLNEHKDPANASEVNRDSLDILRRGAGQFGHYLERDAKGLHRRAGLSEAEEK